MDRGSRKLARALTFCRLPSCQTAGLSLNSLLTGGHLPIFLPAAWKTVSAEQSLTLLFLPLHGCRWRKWSSTPLSVLCRFCRSRTAHHPANPSPRPPDCLFPRVGQKGFCVTARRWCIVCTVVWRIYRRTRTCKFCRCCIPRQLDVPRILNGFLYAILLVKCSNHCGSRILLFCIV